MQVQYRIIEIVLVLFLWSMTFDRRAMGKVGISIIQSMNACLKGVGNNNLSSCHKAK
jgi:hypothetical protein